MVISAAQTGCLSEVMVITAALSIQDPPRAAHGEKAGRRRAAQTF